MRGSFAARRGSSSIRSTPFAIPSKAASARPADTPSSSRPTTWRLRDSGVLPKSQLRGETGGRGRGNPEFAPGGRRRRPHKAGCGDADHGDQPTVDADRLPDDRGRGAELVPPQPLANHNGGRAFDALFRPEQPADGRPDSDDLEVVRRGQLPPHPSAQGPVTAGDGERHRSDVTCQSSDGRSAVAQRVVLGERDGPVNPNQRVRCVRRARKLRQHGRLNLRIDRGRQPGSEREAQHGGKGEPGRSRQQPQGEPGVSPHVVPALDDEAHGHVHEQAGQLESKTGPATLQDDVSYDVLGRLSEIGTVIEAELLGEGPDQPPVDGQDRPLESHRLSSAAGVSPFARAALSRPSSRAISAARTRRPNGERRSTCASDRPSARGPCCGTRGSGPLRAVPQRPIERGRPQSDVAAGALEDLLHDAVAVSLAVGEGYEHVKPGGSQRQERGSGGRSSINDDAYIYHAVCSSGSQPRCRRRRDLRRVGGQRVAGLTASACSSCVRMAPATTTT